MNSVLTVSALLVLACSWAEARPSEAMKKIAEECAKENSIPEGNIPRIFHEGPQAQAEKCFLGCVFTKDGAIVNGKFSKDGAVKKVEEEMKDNADALKMAKDAIEKCASQVTATEACESGPQLRQCISQNAGQMFGGPSGGR